MRCERFMKILQIICDYDFFLTKKKLHMEAWVVLNPQMHNYISIGVDVVNEYC
jgi:hypothetical protein